MCSSDLIKMSVWDGTRLGKVWEYPTHAQRGGQAIIENVIMQIEACIGAGETFDRIGISTAGQVDSVQGMIRYANDNIPGYTGMQVKAILEKAFKMPVVVENDVNAAALGEATYGAGKDYGDFLCLTFGTGIGGAIVMNHQVYTGANFSAGEVGSMIIHPEDRSVGDYFSGSYERYASVSALVERAKCYDTSLDRKSVV